MLRAVVIHPYSCRYEGHVVSFSALWVEQTIAEIAAKCFQHLMEWVGGVVNDSCYFGYYSCAYCLKREREGEREAFLISLSSLLLVSSNGATADNSKNMADANTALSNYIKSRYISLFDSFFI